jgi:hypothetical protein
MQLLPGAPSDPTQPEQPSVLELLGTLAANIYSQDPRYSAAAGLGQGFADIFGGMRQARQQAQQAQILKGLYPDLPLDKFKAAGMKLDLGDLASMQAAQQKQSALAELTKTLDSQKQAPGASTPTGGSRMDLGTWLKYKEAGLPLPESLLKEPGSSEKFPTGNMIAAGGLGMIDPATGQPRPPRTLEEWKALGQAIQQQGVVGAVSKAAAEAGAKQQREGVSKSLSPQTRQKLAEWGIAPETVQPGDPLIGEATDAVGMERAAATMNKQHAQVLESGDKSLQLIGEVRAQLQNVMQAGYSPLALQAWAKVYDLQQKPDKNTGMIADLERMASTFGPIPENVASFFDLIGQLRVTSNQAYAASLATKAASAQQTAQSHIPTNFTDLGRVAGQLDRAENLLKSAMAHSSTTTAKREHLIGALQQAHPDWPYSRAAYLVDKRLGLKVEREGASGPTTPVSAPEDEGEGSE